MKPWHFCALLAAFLLAGCGTFQKEQRLYEVKLKSGLVLYATGQPEKGSDDFYRFEDVNEQSYSIEDRSILYIKPVKFKK